MNWWMSLRSLSEDSKTNNYSVPEIHDKDRQLKDEKLLLFSRLLIIILENPIKHTCSTKLKHVAYLYNRKTLENQRVFIEPTSVPQLPEG